MNRSAQTVIAAFLGCMLFACSSATLTDSRSEPEWVSSPQIGGEKAYGKDAFYGLGKSTLGDLDTALSEARDEARTQVGAAISTEIDKVGEKAALAVTTVAEESNPSGKKKTSLTSTTHKTFKNVEKNIVNTLLRGSTVVASWRDKESGTTWVLARIDKEQAQRAMIPEFIQAADAALAANQLASEDIKSKVESAVQTAVADKADK